MRRIKVWIQWGFLLAISLSSALRAEAGDIRERLCNLDDAQRVAYLEKADGLRLMGRSFAIGNDKITDQSAYLFMDDYGFKEGREISEGNFKKMGLFLGGALLFGAATVAVTQKYKDDPAGDLYALLYGAPGLALTTTSLLYSFTFLPRRNGAMLEFQWHLKGLRRVRCEEGGRVAHEAESELGR